MSSDQVLEYIFAGFVVFLLTMIFWNVLGGPRKKRRRRGRGSSAGPAAVLPGLGSWTSGHDGSGVGDSCASGDSGSCGGDGGGGGGGD